MRNMKLGDDKFGIFFYFPKKIRANCHFVYIISTADNSHENKMSHTILIERKDTNFKLCSANIQIWHFKGLNIIWNNG